METKQQLRARMRAARRAHVAALPETVRALILRRPPAVLADALAARIGDGAIGLYHATGAEAPAAGFARFFQESGRRIALPWFAGRDSPMQFREWPDPWADSGLVAGPHGNLQPDADAALVAPAAVLVPLLAFTAAGERLGQGGGHYDRWLDANPGIAAIGLAWDCQLCETLPIEPHDRRLDAVVTPTRIYGGL